MNITHSFKYINNFIRFTSRENKRVYAYIIFCILYFFDMIITYRAFILGYAYLESNWFIRNMLYSDTLLYIGIKLFIIISIVLISIIIGKISVKAEKYTLVALLIIYTTACLSWIGYWRILL